MNSASSSYKSNNTEITEDTFDSSISRKLRRLKIEENLLLKSVGKTNEDVDYEADAVESIDILNSKVVSTKLKIAFIEIRDLIEELKDNTSSQDLKTVDIEDVKKDVINIEYKIKLFNTYLQSQLKRLKESEDELKKEINKDPNDFFKICRQQKLRPTSLKQIIPSPVKTLIYSPMKCREVQQFQEFLASSKNRCGGWLLYNHNIFEQSWQKYFCTQENIEDFDYQDINVENSGSFQIFINEVCQKIPGILVEDIISHNKWYTKYIFLKKRQQRALEKWKSNRQLIRKSRSKDSRHTNKIESLQRPEKENVNETIQKSLVNNEFEELNNLLTVELTCNQLQELDYNLTVPSTSNESEASNSNISRDLKLDNFSNFQNKNQIRVSRSHQSHRKATKQWNNRCLGEKELCRINMDIENVCKRRIPDWRSVMHATE